MAATKNTLFVMFTVSYIIFLLFNLGVLARTLKEADYNEYYSHVHVNSTIPTANVSGVDHDHTINNDAKTVSNSVPAGVTKDVATPGSNPCTELPKYDPKHCS